MTMLLAHDEPNSLPDVFDDWQEWRLRYGELASAYQLGQIDRHGLRKGLQILGYTGPDLERELDFQLDQKRGNGKL